MDGALIIDKPAGMTSHDVVSRCRRILRERSIGHLGTLDPAATGVLPLLVGRLTRLAQFFQLREKEYEGVIRFGIMTSTYDAEGDVVFESKLPLPALEQVEAALPAFRGEILQQPPPFSAKKVGGIRAYKLARKERPVQLAKVPITVHEFAALGLDGDRLRFRVRCSKGTYIRSLAYDLGVKLGMGAHLAELRRTKVGEFGIDQAVTLPRLEELAFAGALAEVLLPPVRLLPELPMVIAPGEAVGKLLQGRAANLPEFSQAPLVRIFAPDLAPDLRLLAIGSRIAGTLFHPKLVFPVAK